MTVSSNTFNRALQFLIPYMGIEDRQTYIDMAFFGSNVSLNIDFSGSNRAFTTRLIRQLLVYGAVEEGTPATSQLVETVAFNQGKDVEIEGQELSRTITKEIYGDNLPLSREVHIPDLPTATSTSSKEHIFFSYSSLDRPFVALLAKEVKQAGLAVWVDNVSSDYGGIRSGEIWQQSLSNAIHRASHVVFVVSPESIFSKWARSELKRAGELNKPVVPVQLRPLQAQQNQVLATIQVGHRVLSDIHWRDFHRYDFESELSKLLQDLCNGEVKTD